MESKEVYVVPIPGNGPKKGQVVRVGVSIDIGSKVTVSLTNEQGEQLYQKLKRFYGEK
jgi:hypothetical protein